MLNLDKILDRRLSGEASILPFEVVDVDDWRAKKAVELGLFFFLVAISISLITTVEASRSLVLTVRPLSVVVVVVAILFALVRLGFGKYQLSGFFLYFLMLAWGLFLSLLSLSFDIGSTNVLQNFLVTSSGIALFCIRSDSVFAEWHAKAFVLYAILALLLTIFWAGLELTFPPRFVFSHSASAGGGETLYSQGISTFFGFAAIGSSYIFVNQQRFGAGYRYGVLVLLFLALSLVGGARGDSVLAVIVVGLYLMVYARKMFFALCVLLVSFLSFQFYSFDWLEDLTIFQRLLVLAEGNLGSRDLLFAQALDLLRNEPVCLAIGCGFGFFQNYWNYGFGLYPHNFVIESVIVFGLPVVMFFGFFFLRGFVFYFKRVQRLDLFLLIFCYSFLTDLKSGDLMGNWLTISGCVYLITVGFFSPTHRILCDSRVST